MKDLILVTAASGTVGRELVRILKAEGQNVREMTSQPVPAGTTDKVQVNLLTGAGLRAAFEGVDKAFLLAPPGTADQYAVLAPLIQEAKRRGLKKVVLMTAMGANANESTPFRRAEIELEKSGLVYNIIRPNWFLQNFNSFWLQGILQQAKILVPAGRALVSFIDARDISAVAAKLLIGSEFANQDFDLSGPAAVDHDQVALALSQANGRKITYQEISPEAFKQGLVGAGVPVDYADFLVMIFGFLREGYNAKITPHVKVITGREPRSLDQYAKDHRQAWDV